MKRPILAIMAFLMILGMSSLPTYARNGADDASDTPESSLNRGSTGTGTATHKADNETEAENHATEDAIKIKGADLLKEAKKEHKEHTADERKKSCEERKAGLQKKLDNLVKNNQAKQTRTDAALAAVKLFNENNKLGIANWDTLVQTATNAQSKPESSIVALSNLKPTVDCSAGSVASDVAIFKAAASQAKTDREVFRAAVTALLNAVSPDESN